ncbi:deazaflavin-dependent oxidoreductase (nitroreductase family) [Lipingzhangella halophila]|uniref:Deazaflavin-dependent oxidoreductase (Nitroreductase family) n=1 Tax=Lipingzhangella halophila TaxID=1783352 RepID=A0A7W7RJF4_9ACTN|nr:nitroreductase/quinone reductase family protein [Lipingzhangella halophila]MBB4932992.1 deazaflavin-dependent oxidoreductase (nitroreductase family) [Lipingzhangella halophila]
MSDWNETIIAEFRANAGRVGGMFEGAPLLLLTTTGERSGRAHTTPVVFLGDDDNDRLLVFGTAAGAPEHPQWYRNLLVNPVVTVEIGLPDGSGVTSYEASARPIWGAERNTLYARQCALSPVFTDYQARAGRTIPVIALREHAPERARAIGDTLVEVHAELRRDLAALLDAAEEYASGGSPTLEHPVPDVGNQLRDRCVFVCGSLHHHHAGEDGRGFPLLEERYPDLAPVVQKLRDEHVVVAGLKDEVQQAAKKIGTDGDAVQVRDRIRRLVTELEEHFDREERHLVSALNAL